MVTYLGSLVQSCYGEGGTLQTNITGVCGECFQCLNHTGFAPAHVLSQSTLLRLQVALQGSYLKWALGCMHFPGLSRSGSGSPQRRRLGWTCILCPSFPALSNSGGQVLGERALLRCGASYYLPHPSCWVSCSRNAVSGVPCVCSGELISWLRPSWRLSSVQDPRKTWLATGNLLTVWWRMPSLGLSLPLYGSGCRRPSSLLPAGDDGPASCQLALLRYSLSPLFYERPSSALG